jgi:prolyl-tRNA synthetase
MKGVPVRIDIGLKDLSSKKLTVFRRDLNKKELINEKDIISHVKKIAAECGNNLRKEADKLFNGRIKNAKNAKEIQKIIENGGIARVGFCSVEKDGEKCAEVIEKEVGAEVRGTRLDEKQKPSGKCAICGKKARHIVYIARSY